MKTLKHRGTEGTEDLGFLILFPLLTPFLGVSKVLSGYQKRLRAEG
jgi:hypothetical protein